MALGTFYLPQTLNLYLQLLWQLLSPYWHTHSALSHRCLVGISELMCWSWTSNFPQTYIYISDDGKHIPPAVEMKSLKGHLWLLSFTYTPHLVSEILSLLSLNYIQSLACTYFITLILHTLSNFAWVIVSRLLSDVHASTPALYSLFSVLWPERSS